MYGNTVQNVPVGAIYPGMSPTLGQFSSASAVTGGDAAEKVTDSGGNPHVEKAAAIGSRAGSASWFVVIALMLFLLMFGAKKLGTDGDFANIRPTLYNVLTISFAAIIGISFFKFVFTKFPVPGLSTIALAV